MADESVPTAKRARTEGSGCDVAAYPGDEGSLAHIAATRFFSNSPKTALSGVGSFASVFDAVSRGDALYGIIPIENSASGTLRSTYDLLVKHDVVIGGELGVREIYCLCAKSEVELPAVRRVLSHPNILEACSCFLETKLRREPVVEQVPTRSTTDATRLVADAQGVDASAAVAIASREAAVRHGLKVVAEDIGNDAFLETRYILIHLRGGVAASRPAPFPHDVVNPTRKRSACFAIRNEPAAVFKLISCWALRGIDVLKVETRPLIAGHRAPPGLPMGLWDYLFYVDYLVPPEQTAEAGAKLWEALSEFSLWARDFGAYPSCITRAEKQPQSWAEMVDLMAK